MKRYRKYSIMLRSLKLYYHWWKTWGKVPVLNWIRAASWYRLGRFDLAARHYNKGLLSHPSHPARHSAQLDLAYCLFRIRRFDEAQDQLRALIANVPEMRDAHIRLAKIQMWIGHTLDAAWTARRALQHLSPDPELVALFMMNVLEHDGTTYLLQEALKHGESLDATRREHPLLQTAYTKLSIHRGNTALAKEKLLQLTGQINAPLEAYALLAELFIEEGNVAQSRQELKRAMTMAPEHPRILSLFAESYLKSGPFYNADYARQLATSACQHSQWMSPRELHILAESYYHSGDKISALVLASKAKDAGSRLLGSYRNVKTLEKLIETLSSGTAG